jgi:hypothetical protein
LYKKVLIFLALVITTAFSEIDSTLFRIELKSMEDCVASFVIAYKSSEYCDALIYAKRISSFLLKYHEAEQYREWKAIVDQMYWCCDRM